MTEEPSIQHKATHRHLDGFAFENDELVPVVPDVDDDPSEPSPVLAVVLEFCTRATTPARVGERTILLAAILKPIPLRELGVLLGCSHVAARSRLNALRRELQAEFKDSTPPA